MQSLAYNKGSYLQCRISAYLMNTTGATSGRLGGFSRAAHPVHTEGPTRTASRNETSTANAGLSSTKCLRITREIFASPHG